MPKESSMQVNQTKGCLGGIAEKVTFVTQLLYARQSPTT